MSLRDRFHHWEPHFLPGGKWERWYPLYEMVETFLFWTNQTTKSAPHVRDAIDLKRMMSYVVVALIPAVLMACVNTGYQANLAVGTFGAEKSDWRGALYLALGFSFDPGSWIGNFFLGLLHFLPIYLTTLVVGGLWEVLFAIVRKHEINEGFLVTSMLYTLTMPPNAPLWLVALGISFGVVFGKEIFGGTGKNFLNPALTGRVFLFFAYPSALSGDTVWVAVDGYARATPLSVGASDGMAGIAQAGYTWWDAFLGLIPGSLGETSALALLIGGLFLLYTKIASWRIVAGVAIGVVVTSYLFNWFGPDSNPMSAMPWYWHFVVGGLMLAMFFMATDPVSASMTQAGRWIFGLLIGFMVVLIRVANPAFPEGAMLAVLFANVWAPFIDYLVMRWHIARRERRYVSL